MPRSCAGAVQHHPLATTRHPPLPSSPSFGRGDKCRHGRRPRGVAVPDRHRRNESRLDVGMRRAVGVIRWAEPCRTGPCQAHRREPRASRIVMFAGSSSCRCPRTPCFTRERTMVRNHPRLSERCGFTGAFVGSPCADSMCELGDRSRTIPTLAADAREQVRRAPSRLTRESSPGSSRRRHPDAAVRARSLPIGRLQVDDRRRPPYPETRCARPRVRSLKRSKTMVAS
jgi:hypothetical protein